jgi:hypothetical protein
VPHFGLVTLEGVSLGLVELAPGQWRPGNLIAAGTVPDHAETLRVVDVLEADDPEGLTVLVVEGAS